MDLKYASENGLNPQEVLLLMNDMKSVIRSGIPSKKCYKNLVFSCNKYGLHFLKGKFKEGSEEQVFYISKSKSLARDAYEAERGGNKKELGRLLGYPECCIDFFVNDIRMRSQNDPRMRTHFHMERDNIPRIVSIFLNTKDKPCFYNNNIFNSASRPNIDERLLKNKERLKRHNHFLIPHVPCSYTCKKSIKIGETVLELLEKKMPKFADEIVSSLKRIFIVFGEFEFVAIRGKVNKNEITYGDPIIINLNQRDEKALKQGNRMVRDNDKICIFKNETLLHTIKRRSEYHGVVMDFT